MNKIEINFGAYEAVFGRKLTDYEKEFIGLFLTGNRSCIAIARGSSLKTWQRDCILAATVIGFGDSIA